MEKTNEQFWADLVQRYFAKEPRRAAFEFEEGENGCMEETQGSLKGRIAARWGFDPARVVPLETSMRAMFELGGVQYNLHDRAAFSVNGKGWSTDFKDLVPAPQYDEKGGM